MPCSMRYPIVLFLFVAVFGIGQADCAESRTVVRDVSVVVEPDATSIVIEASAGTPYRLEQKADRLEVDLPEGEWRARPPRIDRHAGLIESFRKVPVAQGVRLVFMTRSEFQLRDGGPAATAPNGDRLITLVLAVPNPAPLVTVTGDGPVVIEGSGYVLPNTASPARQAPLPTVQPSVECVARLKQQGFIEGKPVTGFADCP